MTYSDAEIWTIIAVIGAGTYLIRLSFLGIIGDRPLPPLVLRLLRYTPVAVIPGLIAPALFVAEGRFLGDPALLVAAGVTLLLGWRTRNILIAFPAGIAAYLILRYLLSS